MGAQSVRRDSLAASVADMQNSNLIALDGEQNPVYVRPAAIEQMPHLKRGIGIFGREQADNGPARWQAMQSRLPAPETTGCRYPQHVGKTTTAEWLQRRVRIRVSSQPEMPYFRRISVRNSAAGRVRPAFTSS